MSVKETTEIHRLLLQRIKKELYPWRKFTIAIDGVDHSGKSSLARFLAWQLEMPAIESDLFLLEQRKFPVYAWDELCKLVASRHELNRPLIIEGVFVRKILERIQVKPDFSIFMDCKCHKGSEEWQDAFAEYDEKYRPKKWADSLFVCQGCDGR